MTAVIWISATCYVALIVCALMVGAGIEDTRHDRAMRRRRSGDGQ